MVARLIRLSKRQNDSAFLLLVTLALCFWSFYLVRVLVFRNQLPFEDAAILFRYADNLSQGYGYVYNKSGPWVDGASDVIFTLLLALIGLLGSNALNTYSFILSFSLLLLVALPSMIIFRKFPKGIARQKRTLLFFCLFTLPVALSPAIIYNFSGFGTVFHTLLIFLSSYFIILQFTSSGVPNWWIIQGSILIVLANRIESLFLLFLLFLAMRFYGRISGKLFNRLALLAIGSFLFLSLIRMAIIGHPLPNAFYVKGKGKLYFDALQQSFVGVVLTSMIALVLVLAMFIFGMVSTIMLRNFLICLGILGLLWMTIWILLSTEMNMAQRFQFPIYGLLLALIVTLNCSKNEEGNYRSNTNFRRLSVALIVILSISLSLNNIRRTDSFFDVMDGSFAKSIHGSIGKAFKDSIPNIDDYTIATTEAGLVPYMTEATTVDLRGLNDKFISHQGPLTSKQLENIKADFFFLHLNWPKSSMGNVESDWDVMNREAICFLKTSDFRLLSLWSNNLYYDQQSSNAWAIFAGNKIRTTNLKKHLEVSLSNLSPLYRLNDFSGLAESWRSYVVNCHP